VGCLHLKTAFNRENTHDLEVSRGQTPETGDRGRRPRRLGSMSRHTETTRGAWSADLDEEKPHAPNRQQRGVRGFMAPCLLSQLEKTERRVPGRNSNTKDVSIPGRAPRPSSPSPALRGTVKRYTNEQSNHQVVSRHAARWAGGREEDSRGPRGLGAWPAQGRHPLSG
jgi:hypothetical protein